MEDLDNNGQVVRAQSQFDLNPNNVSLLIKLTHKVAAQPLPLDWSPSQLRPHSLPPQYYTPISAKPG